MLTKSEMEHVDAFRPSPSTDFENKIRVRLFGGRITNTIELSHVSLQSEICYAVFGDMHTIDHRRISERSEYMLLPVMARFNHRSRVAILAGPELGMLTSATATFSDQQIDIHGSVHGAELFFAFGLEYVTKDGLGMRFRGQYGIPHHKTPSNVFIHNHGMSLNLSYHMCRQYSGLSGRNKKRKRQDLVNLFIE